MRLKLPELPQIYWYLALARIILVLIPQHGYIHPDEFFQSIEVQAGQVFGIEANIPWEFNSTFPIRSMTIGYFTTGMIYRLLRTLEFFLKDYLEFSFITPYSLIVAPRFLTCVLSFLVDASLYKICIDNNEKYKSKLVVLASSYVIIVYATRTFSNTIELILFALLLYYVCESLTFSNTLLKKREYLNYRYETSRNTVEKAKFHKLRLFLTSDSLRNCLQISTITVFGFFNRPTFLAFAVFPVFFWLYRGMGNKLVQPLNYHWRMLGLILCSIPSLIFHVIVDSFYYGYLTWGEIGVLEVSINNFIFTPLNFIKYNTDTENLSKHGLHPKFLHILVNMPLLFNILAIFAFYRFGQTVYNFFRTRYGLLPTVKSIKGLMMLSYLAPLSLLSIFPHQEPRFLIPLIIPLVYLHASDIYPETDKILIKFDNTVKRETPRSADNKPPVFMKLWFTINVILVLFFGFIHQGGVYQAANYLSNDMRFKSPRTDYYVITSYIYSMPESLFLQEASDKIHYTRTSKYIVSRRYFLFEKGSTDEELLLKDINKLCRRIEDFRKTYTSKKRYKIMLVVPSSLEYRLNYLSKNDVLFKKLRTFYPHLSTEAFPDLSSDLLYSYSNFTFEEIYSSVVFYLHRIVTSFGLNVYEVACM